MAKGGTITGKELITDEGINRPLELKKNLQIVIDKTEELIKVAQKFNNISSKYKGIKNEKEYLAVKKEDIALTKSAIQIEKEKNIASLQAQKIESEILRTKKLALDIERKKQQSSRQSTKLTIAERVQNQANNKVTRLQTRIQLGLVDAYEKLNIKRTNAQRKLANLLSAEKRNIKQIRVAQREYNKLDKRVKAVDNATKNFSKNIGNYKSAIGGLTGTLRGLVSALGLVGGAMAFVSVMRNGIKIVREFGATMSNVAGIYRVSRKDLADLEDRIISVAGSSVKTATEVAKLAESLATLGKSKEEIAQLLEPVNNLSIGLKATSDETAEFLVQTINAFGGSSDEAEKYADTIATIRTSTSLDFQKMRDSFQYLTPISRILNKDLAYTGALIGLLADSGVKAERAGRLLGTAQQKLSKEGKTLAGALEEVNEASKRGVKEEQLLAIASNLFGKQAATLGIILAENSEKIDINADAIRNNGGALDDLVNEQLKSLDAHLSILKSRWEEYILNTDKSSGASNVLKGAIKFLSDNLAEIISVITKVASAFLLWKGVVIATGLVTRIYTGGIIALRIAKIGLSGGIKRATIAFKLFSKAIKVSPLGVFLTALAGAIFLFKKYNKSLSETVKATKESTEAFLSQRKTAADSNTELSKLITRHDELKKKTTLTKDEQIELNKIIKEIAKNVPDAVTEIDKYGDAMSVNTDKAKKFVELQKEVNELETHLQIEKEKNALKKLEKSLTAYNNVSEKNNGTYIEGLGLIKKQSDSFVKISTEISKTGAVRIVETKLTEAQTLAYKKQQLQLEKNIIASKDRIAELDGSADEKRKLEEEAQKKADENAKKEADRLEKEEKARAKRKEAQEEANKDAEKHAREKAELEKKLQKDALELAKFRIEKEIKLNDELTKNEKANFIERIVALEDRTEAEYDLAELNKEFKLKQIQYATDEELAIIKKGGDEAVELKKEIATREKDARALILEEYYAEIREIEAKNKKDSTDLLAFDENKFKKGLDNQLDALTIQGNDELTLLNEQLSRKEITQEEHEKKVKDLKIKYAKEALEAQLKGIQALLKGESLSVDLRQKYEKQVSEIKLQLSEISIENSNNETSKTLDNLEKLKYAYDNFGTLVADLGNAVFDNRIKKIDEEIEKSEEFYNRQYELADGDATQQALIQEEAEKKRKALEKKKRKEQRKQAILNKSMAALEIGLNTGIAIVKSVAASPTTGGLPFSAIASAIGALQLATVLAKPIPKYAKGTDYHKGGFALVGEERPEVITEPNKAPYIVSNPSVLDLPTGTQVTPSIDEYERLMRASILTSLDIENNKLNHFQSKQSFDTNNDLLNEIKGMRKDLKKKKPTIINLPKTDIDHAIWKNNNIDW